MGASRTFRHTLRLMRIPARSSGVIRESSAVVPVAGDQGEDEQRRSEATHDPIVAGGGARRAPSRRATMTVSMSDEPAGKPEVKLDPAFQARLLEQMREEQEGAMRARQIRLYVVYPLIALVTIVGIAMSFSSNRTTAIVGHVMASSILYVLWSARKRIAKALGF